MRCRPPPPPPPTRRRRRRRRRAAGEWRHLARPLAACECGAGGRRRLATRRGAAVTRAGARGGRAGGAARQPLVGGRGRRGRRPPPAALARLGAVVALARVGRVGGPTPPPAAGVPRLGPQHALVRSGMGAAAQAGRLERCLTGQAGDYAPSRARVVARHRRRRRLGPCGEGDAHARRRGRWILLRRGAASLALRAGLASPRRWRAGQRAGGGGAHPEQLHV